MNEEKKIAVPSHEYNVISVQFAGTNEGVGFIIGLA